MIKRHKGEPRPDPRPSPLRIAIHRGPTKAFRCKSVHRAIARYAIYAMLEIAGIYNAVGCLRIGKVLALIMGKCGSIELKRLVFEKRKRRVLLMIMIRELLSVFRLA